MAYKLAERFTVYKQEDYKLAEWFASRTNGLQTDRMTGMNGCTSRVNGLYGLVSLASSSQAFAHVRV